MADGALSTEARWHAVVSYRTGGAPLAVEMSLEEIEDLHDRIELGSLVEELKPRQPLGDPPLWGFPGSAR